MQLEQLNEFSLFKKKEPKITKLPYTVSNHTAKFTLKPYTRIEISHKADNEGGGYDVRLNGAKQELVKDVSITVDEAIDMMVVASEEWINTGKKGKTETLPADLIQIRDDMFDIKKLKQELSYKRK